MKKTLTAQASIIKIAFLVLFITFFNHAAIAQTSSGGLSVLLPSIIKVDEKTAPTRKRDPIFGTPYFYETDIEEINAKALTYRPAGSENPEDSRVACWKAAQEVTKMEFNKSGAPTFCIFRLNKEMEADVERRKQGQAAAFAKEQSDKRQEIENIQIFMRQKSEEIARRIEAGDGSAWGNCSKDASGQATNNDFYNTCISIAQPALIRALRSKKISPDNCRKWGIAITNENEKLPSAMLVSIESEGKIGSFSGQVTQLEGKTLILYDPSSYSNAIAMINGKTQIFNGDKVAVGRSIYGVGIQTGTRQVTLANGQASTVAVISATCVGDY